MKSRQVQTLLYLSESIYSMTSSGVADLVSEILVDAADRLDELERASQDVLDHWDTPAWKNMDTTAKKMNKLRNVLNNTNEGE